MPASGTVASAAANPPSAFTSASAARLSFLLDIEELNADWTTEIQNGSFAGLVVRTDLISRLPQSSHFVPFDDEHLWIPYTGSKAF